MDISQLLDSITRIEYLTTFNAFVYSYIISKFFTAWGKLINNRQYVIFSIDHILWSVFTFLMLISLWWKSWLEMGHITHHSWSFYSSIVSPLILYVISSLFFPEFKQTGKTDLSSNSRLQQKRSAVLYLVLYVYNLNRDMMNDFTTNLVIFYLIGIVVCLLVIIFKNKWLGRIALATGFITLLTYMVFLPSYTKSDAWLINGYSFSEYIITFSTFLYGFIVTRFLDGWAFYFAKRKELRVNITFVLWSFLIFGLLFDFWWGLWDRRISSSLSIGHFCFSLAIPLGFYLLSSVLFSGIFSKPFRAQLFITDNAFLFFGSLIFIFVADFAFAVIIHQRSFQDIQNLFLVLPIGLCTIALAKRSVLAHRLVLVLAWTFLIIHNFV